jgi:hypothetical protein
VDLVAAALIVVAVTALAAWLGGRVRAAADRAGRDAASGRRLQILALFGPAAASVDDRGDRIARVWQIRERLKSRLEESPVEEEAEQFEQAQWPNWRNYWPNWPNWNNWQNWNNWFNWRNW